MEVWNPMLWEFSRVMRECHRKIGAMLGKDKPPVGQAPIMGLLRTQDGLTQEEVSERLQRNETSVALAGGTTGAGGIPHLRGRSPASDGCGTGGSGPHGPRHGGNGKAGSAGFYGRGHRPAPQPAGTDAPQFAGKGSFRGAKAPVGVLKRLLCARFCRTPFFML